MKITKVTISVSYVLDDNGVGVQHGAIGSVLPVTETDPETLAQLIERATRRVRLHLPEQLR